MPTSRDGHTLNTLVNRYRSRVRHREIRDRHCRCGNIPTRSDHEGSSPVYACHTHVLVEEDYGCERYATPRVKADCLNARWRMQCLIPVVMSGIIAVYSLVIAVLIAEDMRPPNKNEGSAYSLFKYVVFPFHPLLCGIPHITHDVRKTACLSIWL
jgi:hypothetical protein